MRKVPTITDLSEENRKLAHEQVEILLHWLKQCEAYGRDYAAGDVTVLKLMGMMATTDLEMKEVLGELRKLNEAK